MSAPGRFRRRALGLLALASVSLFPACGSPDPEVRQPNLVLISIDSLRPDRLGAYGHDRPTSPNIDRLASESIVFDRAYSVTTWTLPSHLSLLTSLYPAQHGVHEQSKHLNEAVVMLPEVLAQVGYRSAAVVSGMFLHHRFGYDQGWESYDDSLLANEGKDHNFFDITSEGIHAKAVELLDGFGQDPFFLFLHYFDVHYDYIPPPPLDTLFDPDYEGDVSGAKFVVNLLKARELPERDLKHLWALYDGEIRWVDRWIGALLDELDRRDLDENTVVVLVADHGDEFLEHGRFGHNNNLFDTTLRIPMIVRLPGGRRGGERSDRLASLVDVAPTLLSAAGLPAPSSFVGVDLLGPPTADAPQREIFAALRRHRHAILTGPWKAMFLRQGGRFRNHRAFLHDLDADPGERHNLAQAQRERLLEFKRRLADADRRFLRSGEKIRAGKLERDPEFEARLRALGYL